MKCSREDFDALSYLPRNHYFAAALQVGLTGGSQADLWPMLEETITDAVAMATDEHATQPEGVDLDYWFWFKDSVVLLYENLNVRHEDWSQVPACVRIFGDKVCTFPLPPLHGYPALPGRLLYEGKGIYSIHPQQLLGDDDFAAPYTPHSERTGPAINWKGQN